MNIKYNIKCNSCGRFVKYLDIEQGKCLSEFIPDSDVSYEEYLIRCSACSIKHGKPLTKQNFYRVYNNLKATM